MPIYEYICPDCQHEFEQIQKISDAPLSHCGECGGGHLKKKVSATSFHLKGSGWYRDHYGLKPESGKSTGESESGGSTESSGGSSEPAPSSPTTSSDASTSSTSSTSGDTGGD